MSADVIRLRKPRKPRKARAPEITDLLPFVKVVTRGGRRSLDRWAVKPTGDMIEDTKIGTDYGVAFLDYLVKTPGDMTIHSISAAQERMMKMEHYRSGHGWSLITGFWTPILMAARLGFQAHRGLIRAMGQSIAADMREAIEREYGPKAAARRRALRKRKGGAA
jgi:hypothetical protein